MNFIEKGLWLGDSADAHPHNTGVLKEQNISAVLNVAFDLVSRLTYPEFMSYHCGLVDGHGNSVDAYLAAILTLRTLLQDQKRTVLIHCHEGKSRSASIIVGYWLLNGTILNWEDGVKVLQQLRPIVDPAPAHKEMVLAAISKLREYDPDRT